MSEVFAAANFPCINYNNVLIRFENKLEIIILINIMKGQTSHLNKHLFPMLHGRGREEEKEEKKNTNYVLLKRINQHLLKKQNHLITTALANLMLLFYWI